MAEYIEREKIFSLWKSDPAPASIDSLAKAIWSAPAADVAPVRWMPVIGFDGLYEVSNFGKVRNKHGKILKQGIKRTPCTCYKVVHLWKDGRYYTKYVHRLIAEAFIPNPDNLDFINHKDEDGTNNDIDNLEWCTREYNVNYGTAISRMAKKIRGKESEKRIPVYATDKDGNFAGEWPSITSAAKDVGCSTSEISGACKGKRKSVKDLVWKYASPNCGAKMDLEG